MMWHPRLASSVTILASVLFTCGCQTGAKRLAATAAPLGPAEAADIQQSMSNLRRVHESIAFYQNAHGGKLPPNLGATLPYGTESWEAPADGAPAELTPAEKAAAYLSPGALKRTRVPARPTPEWVNRNTSYVYLADERVVDEKVPEWDKTALAHEPLELRRGAVAVLMFDGHVEAMEPGRAEAVIETSKQRIRAAQALASR